MREKDGQMRVKERDGWTSEKQIWMNKREKNRQKSRRKRMNEEESERERERERERGR